MSKADVIEIEGVVVEKLPNAMFQVELENGYLTISASKGLDKDEQDKDGRYIRRERYAGSCSRSFYVGDTVKPEDVHAKFENGILQIALPKQEQKQLPSTTAIAIE